MRPSLADGLIFVGASLVLGGLVAINWIYAMIFVGVLIMALGLAMASRGK